MDNLHCLSFVSSTADFRYYPDVIVLPCGIVLHIHQVTDKGTRLICQGCTQLQFYSVKI